MLAIDVGPQGSLSAWGNRRDGNGSIGERFFVDRLAAKRIRHLPAFLETLTANDPRARLQRFESKIE